MRTVTTFDRVTLSSSKEGTCPTCGKKAKRSKTVGQTVNPFNKLPDGSIKSPQDIKRELRTMLKAWREEPVYHARCEP